jgi:uncharacterized protein (TIGR02231 family)
MSMRTVWALGAIALGLCFSPVSAHAAPSKAVTSKITAVTIYADRARVTRTATVDLSQGRLVIPKLPGWVDQDSVRVSLSPARRGQILDVTTETTYLAKASDKAVREAQLAVRAITDQLHVISDEKRIVDAEVVQLEATRAFSMKKLPRDMATRPVKIKTYGETIDFISTRLRKARAALRDLEKQRRKLLPTLNARTRAYQNLRRHAKMQHSRVVVHVKGTGRATLTLTYLTPGAAWEPMAEIRTIEGKRATLVQYASVIQTTGEDWTGAKLTFSTQRPADTLQVPVARVLSLGSRSAKLHPAMDRKKRSFDRAASAYRVRNNNMVNQTVRANIVRQQRIQTRSIAAFRTLQKRGTTVHFVAESSRPVRPNGKAVRLPIARSTFEVKSHLVAVPEVSLNAVRTAKLVNTSEQPILPGTVALFVDGAFVGKSELAFVAPGETFSVYLGVNDRLKLSRTLDRKRSSYKRGRKTTEMTVSYLVRVQNLGKKPVTINMTDRVPVTENDAIEIDDIVIPRGAKRGSDGLVRWSITLAPGQKAVWRIGYEVEYPNALLAQGRKLRPKKRYRGNRHYPGAQKTKNYDFADDLIDLEKQLK